MTTDGVGAPGRCRLASASRASTERGRGALRASAIAARRRSAARRAPARSRRRRRCATVVCGLGDDRERRPAPRAASRRATRDSASAAGAVLGDEIAKQRRDRQVVRAPERRDREGERGQQAVERAERQFARIDRRRERIGQRRAGERRDEIRRRRADARARSRRRSAATARNSISASATLAPPLAPSALRIASVARLRSTKPLRRVGDADAADHQRNQPDQRQELAEAVEVARKVRRDVAARRAPPSPLPGKFALASAIRRLDRGVARRRARRAHQHARRPADQRARLHEPARAQRVAARSARAAPKPRPVPSRSGSETTRARMSRFEIAEREAVADLQIEPVEQRVVDQRADSARRARRAPRRRQRRIERGRAERSASPAPTALRSTSVASPAALRAIARAVATSLRRSPARRGTRAPRGRARDGSARTPRRRRA